MNLYSPNHPQLCRKIVLSVFLKNVAFSLEHSSVNIKEYQDIFELMQIKHPLFHPTRYFIFTSLEDGFVYITFKDNIEVDLQLNINTGEIDEY